MHIEVRYASRTGNTKKVAEAIAEALGITAHDVSHPIAEKTDLLFLGGGVYGSRLAKPLRQFIQSLPASKIKKVAVFSTSLRDDLAYTLMKDALRDRIIPVYTVSFHCPGSLGPLQQGKPDAQDLKNAAAFAKKIQKAAERGPMPKDETGMVRKQSTKGYIHEGKVPTLSGW